MRTKAIKNYLMNIINMIGKGFYILRTYISYTP